jgi:hypothetical protein
MAAIAGARVDGRCRAGRRLAPETNTLRMTRLKPRLMRYGEADFLESDSP